MWHSRLFMAFRFHFHLPLSLVHFTKLHIPSDCFSSSTWNLLPTFLHLIDSNPPSLTLITKLSASPLQPYDTLYIPVFYHLHVTLYFNYLLIHIPSHPPSLWCFQSRRQMVAYTVMQFFDFRKNAGSFGHTLIESWAPVSLPPCIGARLPLAYDPQNVAAWLLRFGQKRWCCLALFSGPFVLGPCSTW